MPRRRHRPAIIAAASLLATTLSSACLGLKEDGPTGPIGNSDHFTAVIDGTAWTGLTATLSAGASPGGLFSLVGTDASGTGILLTLYNIGAPGAYPLGVGASVFGGSASLIQGSSTWWTPLSGAAGTITLASVSATRIVGTFSFVAVPVAGTGASRTVTAGSFDLDVVSTPPFAVAANQGNRFGGTLGGQPWNAATVVMVSGPATGTVGIGISNSTHQIDLTLSGFTGAATYGLNTGVARYFAVTRLGTSVVTWGGSTVTSSGSVVVTSAGASRLVGTYDVSLPPIASNPTAGTLTMTGTFDVGVPLTP